MSPTLWFAAAIVAWVLGFWFGREWQRDWESKQHRDCFYCHECVLCKRDDDAKWCRPKPITSTC